MRLHHRLLGKAEKADHKHKGAADDKNEPRLEDADGHEDGEAAPDAVDDENEKSGDLQVQYGHVFGESRHDAAGWVRIEEEYGRACDLLDHGSVHVVRRGVSDFEKGNRSEHV